MGPGLQTRNVVGRKIQKTQIGLPETALYEVARATILLSLPYVSPAWWGFANVSGRTRVERFLQRTGSWLMHVRAVSESIPIFAAAGHYNYLKSAHFYVQQMGQLHINHPDVFRKFENGYHFIRRSNQFWAGLSSDLVIEQTLMRSLKTCGCLTRGSGLSDEQRALWTM